MGIFEWGNITHTSYKNLLYIGLIINFIIFYVIEPIVLRYPINFKNMCLKTSSHPLWLKLSSYAKNKTLYPEYTIQQVQSCVFSLWELSHILFHVFIGYYYNIYISLGVGISWELYEHYFRGHASGIDIGYNTIGFLIGHGLKKIL
jgi:hypothetical protein